MMPNQLDTFKVDYLFVGAGASSTLLLMQMETSGLLENKNLLILDPDNKLQNDKTYCFWSNEDQPIVHQCKKLISKEWKDIRVNKNKYESMSPMKYYHISAMDVYNEQRRIIQEYGIKRFNASVIHLESIGNGVRIITDQGACESTVVFDSRPPKYQVLNKQDAHLLQSFVGFVIVTEKEIENEACIDLMDFEIEQMETTQFMYVLPFHSKKILVELTRFGNETLNQEESVPLLTEYILQRFGKFKILHTETGCIPMSTAALHVEKIPGVYPIGGRAGRIKPSTGYAFKNMFEHASQIVNCVKSNQTPTQPSTSIRFQFYDRLLLLILTKFPFKGKVIFQQLFKNNHANKILKFLDEKTNILQEIRIFSTLPLKPFLLASWWITKEKIRPILNRSYLLLFTCILWILHKTTNAVIFNWMQSVFFLIGLIAVGLPHGAVDHLLESRKINSRISPIFIIGYLSMATMYFILWLLAPNVAILFFVVYSAWHFGQTDMQEWYHQKINPVKNFFWGILLLSIILFGHLGETNNILNNMRVWTIPAADLNGRTISFILGIIASVWAILERKWLMLASIAMLIISLNLPLLTSFGLYFIGQHSLSGWSHLKKGMKTQNMPLYLKALPFTLGALVLLALMTYGMKNNYIAYLSDRWMTIFFVFISCISFPHVISMNKFYKKYN